MASFRRIEIIRDDASPNVFWIEPDAEPTLIQVNADRYEAIQGRRLLGSVVFHDGPEMWGWCFYPRQLGKRPSRVLHPNPEAAVKRRIAIRRVITVAQLEQIA